LLYILNFSRYNYLTTPFDATFLGNRFPDVCSFSRQLLVVDTRLLRDEYEIPDEVVDSDAESVLAAVLSDIVSGDLTGAEEQLRTAFSTVCERETPEE